jgi:hypothetical protein
MAKKEKIAIQRDSTLEQVDAELDSAMSQLDGANQKVEELLSSFVAPEPRADGSAAAELDDGEEAPAGAPAAPTSEAGASGA